MRRLAGEDGYVTIAVLVVSALFAAIVSSLLIVSRPSIGLARIGAQELAAEGLVEGGLNAAGFLLFAEQRDPREVNGAELRFGTGTVSVALKDEGARISINDADEDFLAGLFEAVGGTSMTPTAFGGRVVDWRDEDDDVSDGGAESADYEAAGARTGPPNRPFRSVEELGQILELSGEDFARLAPYVTVYSGRDTVDPLSAPATVLRSIPYVTRGEVERMRQARRNGYDREEIVDLARDAEDYLMLERSGVYRVELRAQLRDGFSATASAVIRKAEDGADFHVLAWWRGASGTGQ